MGKLPRPVPWLAAGESFPPLEQAWGHHDPAPGLLAAGAALDVPTLVQAYSQGIFPWFSLGQPPLWWSPDPRMVLQTRHFRLHRSLRKTLALAGFARAGMDDLFKSAVKTNLAAGLSLEASQRFAQRTMQPEMPRLQDHAGIGTPPQRRLAQAEPRKNTLRIGLHQCRHIQCSAGSQQAGGRVVMAPGLFERRKAFAGGKPGHGAREFSHCLKAHRQEMVEAAGREWHAHMVAEPIHAWDCGALGNGCGCILL